MAGALAYKLFDDDYSDAQDTEVKQAPLKAPVASRSEFTPAIADDDPVSSEERSGLILPVRDLSGHGCKLILNRPIPLEVDAEEGQFVVSHDDTHVVGWGSDLFSALSDFGNAFVEVYRSYVESRDELSPEAQRFAGFLKSLIAKVEEI